MYEFLAFVAFATWIGFFIAAIVAKVRRRPGRRWLYSLVALIVFVVICSTDPNIKQASQESASGTGSQASQESASVTGSQASQSTTPPQNDKQSFAQSVDRSVTATRIEGNPYKFVGKHVDLRCTVSEIPQEDFFNAECGVDADGMPVG